MASTRRSPEVVEPQTLLGLSPMQIGTIGSDAEDLVSEGEPERLLDSEAQLEPSVGA